MVMGVLLKLAMDWAYNGYFYHARLIHCLGIIIFFPMRFDCPTQEEVLIELLFLKRSRSITFMASTLGVEVIVRTNSYVAVQRAGN